MKSLPRLDSDVALVTTIPVPVEISNAGICETSPSPTDRIVNLDNASAIGIPCINTPIINPPITLTKVIRIPATASPFTNLEAPSIAP